MLHPPREKCHFPFRDAVVTALFYYDALKPVLQYPYAVQWFCSHGILLFPPEFHLHSL